MEKINSLFGIDKYFCSICNHFHIRKYKYIIDKNGNRIKTKDTPFFQHKESAYLLSSTEIFKQNFKRSWNNYNIETHKHYYGSKKQ